MKVLSGHTSPETAYVVEDYPYGFRLRCRIRYWLEHRPKFGFRLMSQTTNPKRLGEPWNKPKGSTYCHFGVMILDDKGHVTWSGIHAGYADSRELQDWLNNYSEGLSEKHRDQLHAIIAAKVAYESHRKDGDPLERGLAEARVAYAQACTQRAEREAEADHIDGYDRDDLGESPDH